MTRPGMWRVPRIWNGGTCFMLGGGPSLRAIDVDRLRGHHVISINISYKIAPWADAMFFADCRWLPTHGDGLVDFPGLKVTCCSQHVNKPGIKVVVKKNAPYGLARDPHQLFWNLSSGACAIGLAVHLGARRIVLLGYDMRRVDERNNWHDDYPKMTGKRIRNPYPRFLKPFPAIAAALNDRNIECINATPGSELREFPIVEPETVLPPKVEPAPDEPVGVTS